MYSSDHMRPPSVAATSAQSLEEHEKRLVMDALQRAGSGSPVPGCSAIAHRTGCSPIQNEEIWPVVNRSVIGPPGA